MPASSDSPALTCRVMSSASTSSRPASIALSTYRTTSTGFTFGRVSSLAISVSTGPTCKPKTCVPCSRTAVRSQLVKAQATAFEVLYVPDVGTVIQLSTERTLTMAARELDHRRAAEALGATGDENARHGSRPLVFASLRSRCLVGDRRKVVHRAGGWNVTARAPIRTLSAGLQGVHPRRLLSGIGLTERDHV
jgi:hypothetical protein